MFLIKFGYLILLFSIFQVTSCERRIVDGDEVTSDKSYAVYLIKAKDSVKTYDAWLCGGAIVTKWFILTSAACVEDVSFMYAIAGYRKYVKDRSLETDECTKNMKKKIVYRCVPISYEFDFNQIEKWAYVDIALVKVESPYDFQDSGYQIICSYIPRPIPINYDLKRQATNADAMVLGWGHTSTWREPSDDMNYNSENLLFGSTILYDKQKCAQEYKDYPELAKIIEKYMICTYELGHVNDHGVPHSMSHKRRIKKDICITEEQKEKGVPGEVCETQNMNLDKHPEEDLMNRLMHAKDGRKRMSSTEVNHNVTNYKDIGTDSANRTDVNIANGNGSISKTGFGNISGYFNGTFTRRNGICQNDHGGPLVTWVGKREVLIGIASVFKITADRHCIGPYLYTSTVCNGAFLGCVLGDVTAIRVFTANGSLITRTAQLCESAPSVKGFDTIESYVSWKDHPDGPADNEKSMLRNRPDPNRNEDSKNEKDDSEEQFVNLFNDRNTQRDIVPKFTTTIKEQEPNDRFAINIGIPHGMKSIARKRPRLRKRRPSITRPPLDDKSFIRPKMSAPINVKPSSIIRSPPKMDSHLIVNNPPTHTEISSTITYPPKMENPPNIRYSQEMEPSPFLRPVPMLRPRPIITPLAIIRPRPIVEPLLKMEPPNFELTQDIKSEEEFVKKLFE